MYWGPGEAGKTTCYYRLLDVFAEFRVSHGFSIATTDERTLWNDSVHFSFPIPQMNAKVITNVATATGQERFLSTREYVLENADGAMFVADSKPEKMDKNKRSFEELVAFTRENKIPIVIQLNKRDLEPKISVFELKNALGLPGAERDRHGFKIVYPTIAIDPDHKGAERAFFSLLQKVLKRKFVD